MYATPTENTSTENKPIGNTSATKRGLLRRAASIAITTALAGGLAVATAAPAAADVSGDYTFEMNATGATITDYSGPGGTLVIPATVKKGLVDVPVTAIGDNAFAGKALTSVTIPATATSLGSAAFLGNELTSVTIPNSVGTMGNDVFNGNKLASVTLSTSLTSIPAYAFANNLLTSVTIPSSVTSIGGFAFGWNQLTGVTLPSLLGAIGAGAFFGSPITSVTIPASVRSIGQEAFGFAVDPTLTRVLLAGDAPTVVDATAMQPTFDSRAALTVYYNADSRGYALDTGGRWQGYDAMPLKLAASIDKTSIAQGDDAALTGGVAFPGATVTAYLDNGSGTAIGSATATDTGAFALPVTIPAGSTVGARTLVITSAFAGTTLQQQIPIIVTKGDAGPGTPPAACTVKPFSDVKTSNKHCSAIAWLAGEGIYKSATDKYRPGQQLNRRVVARFLYRMSDTTTPQCTVKPTKDVKKGNKFCRVIKWATANSIIKPTKANNFKPKKAVTRAALADALYRFSHDGSAAPACTVKPFKDVKKKNRYCGAVTWAKDTGVITGTSATKFKPAKVVKRGQAATFLQRAAQRLN